jgi:hypothetical protein
MHLHILALDDAVAHPKESQTHMPTLLPTTRTDAPPSAVIRRRVLIRMNRRPSGTAHEPFPLSLPAVDRESMSADGARRMASPACECVMVRKRAKIE